MYTFIKIMIPLSFPRGGDTTSPSRGIRYTETWFKTKNKKEKRRTFNSQKSMDDTKVVPHPK